MTILSSTHSGKFQFIHSYFREKYPTMNFEITINNDKEYVCVLRPMDIYGSIVIDLNEVPCKITFENMPNLYIRNANKNTIKKLEFRFGKKCNTYKFEKTIYKEDDFDFVKDRHSKIYDSTIYILDDMTANEETFLSELSFETTAHNNKIMIKYKENNDYIEFNYCDWWLKHCL